MLGVDRAQPSGEPVTGEDLAAAAVVLRRVLAAVDEGELSCSAAYRNRLQGAVVALESLAEASAADHSGDTGRGRAGTSDVESDHATFGLARALLPRSLR